MKKELICIRCPIGCRLSAEWKGNFEELNISGNRCPRGAEYAKQELCDPRRIVTAVVPCNSALQPYIPVRTDRELPKHLIDRLLNILYRCRVEIPVRRGDILIKNFENSNVNVIFSSTITR